jgi:hypothetical protein
MIARIRGGMEAHVDGTARPQRSGLDVLYLGDYRVAKPGSLP